MNVLVKWHKSPLGKYGLPFGVVGNCNLIDAALAEKIKKESPDMIEIIEKEKPIEVEDAMVKQTRTRPVKREKKS